MIMKNLRTMTSAKKIGIFSALILAVTVIALALWLVPIVLTAEKVVTFMSDFDKINGTKPPLSIAQIEQLMGQPIRIEQSETSDQTINGTIYHYPTYPVGGDFRVIFVNGVVFGTAIPVYTKS